MRSSRVRVCVFSCIFAGRSDDAQALSSQNRRFLKKPPYLARCLACREADSQSMTSCAGLHLCAGHFRPSRQSNSVRLIVDRCVRWMSAPVYGMLLAHSLCSTRFFGPGFLAVGDSTWQRVWDSNPAYARNFIRISRRDVS